LYRKSAVNSKVRKILFAVFVSLCLVLLFVVVMKTRNDSVDNAPQEQTSVTAGQIAQQIGPLALIAAFWIILIFVWPRMRLRRIYRNSPALQGAVTVQATLDSFSAQTSTGSVSRTSWGDIKSWHEGNGLMLLIHPTKVYQVINVRDLSEPQRDELRGILTSVLPRK
jgi:hypothetical protein